MHKGRKFLIQTIIVPFLIAITTLTAEAQNMSQIDIATKYYNALYSGEYDTVRSVASPDMLFEDPTAPEEFGIPSRIESLDECLKFIEANTPGKIEIEFTDKYVSNDRVVLKVKMNGTAPAEIFDMGEEGNVAFTMKGVSILHVVDGRVIHHSDYMDYSGTVLRKLED